MSGVRGESVGYGSCYVPVGDLNCIQIGWEWFSELIGLEQFERGLSK